MAESFKYGNGVWATKEGSSLAYNDENDNYKPLPFSVTRDSIATRVNKQGLIEVVGHDKLRIDYTDSTKGVALLEPSRTNYVPRSEDIDTNWAKGNVSITNNNTISPDGSQNAAKITENTNTTTHVVYDTLTGRVSPSVTCYFSCFIKKGTKRYIQLREGFSNTQANIDTNTFTVVNSNNLTDYEIQEYGNGWHRISFKFTANSSGDIQFACYLLNDSQNTSYTGDGTSYVYLWGAMIEQGSYATSYIPTSGSTVTRAADVANGAGNSEVFNDSEGILFVDVSTFVNDNVNRQISVSNGTTSNSIKLTFIDEDSLIFERKTSSGDTQDTIDFLSGKFTKIAFQYKSNGYKAFLNGFEVSLTQSANLPTTLNTLNFDNGIGSADFYGKAKRISVYDAVLTDAELEALTSYTSFTNMANELNLTIK